MNEKANKNGVSQEAEISGNVISRTENPCVGGSIPSLATNLFSNLQTTIESATRQTPQITPQTIF
jgi:hypothetical protein